MKTIPIEERFFKYVKKTPTCWQWVGLKAPNGYGRLGLSKSEGMRYAHRISWMLHHGKIEDGKLVCHKCDNRECVNPSHLFIGTHADNNRDRINKGRKGIMPQSKLNQVKVSIIKMLHPMFTMDELAKRFGVVRNAIWQVTSRKTWISNHGGI